jgi:DNA-binding GntR family transcriptional regulator
MTTLNTTGRLSYRTVELVNEQVGSEAVEGITRISSVEHASQSIQRDIVRGELEPGSALKLQKLAERYSMSLIPVREALRGLEAEGFVESIPNRGYLVAAISADDIVDVYETRIVLETDALRRGFPNLTPEVLQLARDFDTATEELFAISDPMGHRFNRLFHFTLYGASGSRWLLRLIETLWNHTDRYRLLARPELTLWKRHSEHAVILDALEAGDVEGAFTALKSHLRQTVQILLESYP